MTAVTTGKSTKISISIPDTDLAFIDSFARGAGISRSAAIHLAVRELKHRDLGEQYTQSFHEMTDDDWAWTESGIRDGMIADEAW